MNWNEALAVTCPRCGARPKKKCKSLTNGTLKRWPHPPRVRAYQAKDRNDTHDRTDAACSRV